MGFARRTAAAAAAAGLALSLVACGSDKSGDEGAGSPSGDASTTPATPTPSVPPALSGTWTEDAGQADRVQQALEAKKFECTKHSDPAADLRLCSIAKPETNSGLIKYTLADVSFASDLKGTVVLARVRAAGNDDSVATFEKAIAEAILPAADAAVFLADGKTLTWGTADGNTAESAKTLVVKGYQAGPDPFVPAFSSLPFSKEQALPVMQAAKLKCRFTTGTDEESLACSDPQFGDGTDGPMSAMAELTLLDPGTGIKGIKLNGHEGKTTAFDTNAVRALIPRLPAVQASLQDVATWALKHLDGLPHSAYVGQWRVELQIQSPGGMFGDSVRLDVAPEADDLGLRTER